MNFSNSIFFEIKSYKFFVFNPIRVFDILYNDNSEDRTPIFEEIVQREVFSTFAKKLQTFGNGKLFEAFESFTAVEYGRSKDLQDLCEYFAAVVEDFVASYDADDPYYSYCYAVLLISIILATAGYFPDALLYKFVHTCRKNAILKI